MCSSRQGFVRDEKGYVAVLALIMMPLLLGFSLLVIDVGRGNNLHTDLQNAVDGLALAAARELDGGADAIDRANTAIATLLNNQARFSNGGAVIIDETQVAAIYLTDIPASDDDPIDADWIDDYETDEGEEAVYALVRANPRQMTSLFPLPVGLTTDTVTMQAEAVATYDVAACDVTPIYFCNPFEGQEPSLESRFASGDLYARQISMTLDGGSGPGPGNYGFLRFGGGTGAAALGRALATSNSESCYSTRNLETEPGVAVGQSITGINVRFGIYEGAMGGKRSDFDYRPALNVRKGASNPATCNSYQPAADPNQAMPLPSGAATTTFPGGTLHSDSWDAELENYWRVNHPAHVSGSTVTIPDIPRSSYPGDGTLVWPPSRYDIYRYEIEQTYNGVSNLLADPSRPNPSGHMSPNGERGVPNTGGQCYTGGGLTPGGTMDRRVIFSAIVNCNAASAAGELNGQKTISAGNVVGFSSVFLTRPALHSGSTRTMFLEIQDITGQSGNNTLDVFLREEAMLVR